MSRKYICIYKIYKFLKTIDSTSSRYLLVLVTKVWLSFNFKTFHSIKESEKIAVNGR